MIAKLKFLTMAHPFINKNKIYYICTELFAEIKALIINLSNDQLVEAMQNNKKVIEEVLE